jgi:hypothetical protein
MRVTGTAKPSVTKSNPMRTTHSSKLYLTGRDTAPRTKTSEPPRMLHRLASEAGIEFNGSRPWDIQVRDAAVYRRIMTQGSLGLGEAYMDGLCESEHETGLPLETFFGNHITEYAGPRGWSGHVRSKCIQSWSITCSSLSSSIGA